MRRDHSPNSSKNTANSGIPKHVHGHGTPVITWREYSVERAREGIIDRGQERKKREFVEERLGKTKEGEGKVAADGPQTGEERVREGRVRERETREIMKRE